MVDYRRFLASATSEPAEVLPYLGGPTVDARTRRLRIASPPASFAPGWWSFTVVGRHATPVAPADPPDLAALPRVSGHAAAGYVFAAGGVAERFALDPPDEPALFAVVTGRRWTPADLVFDSLGFEGDAEEQVRRAYEDGGSLTGIADVASSLRAAFGFALLRCEARARDTFVVAAEVMTDVAHVAGAGPSATGPIIDRIVRERQVRRALDPVRAANRRRPDRLVAEDPIDRAADALAGAGAVLLGGRLLDNGTIEVRYRFLGERWESVVDADTLQVYDAGLCLAGADRELTLESLPAVIREAIAVDVVHVTRYVD